MYYLLSKVFVALNEHQLLEAGITQPASLLAEHLASNGEQAFHWD